MKKLLLWLILLSVLTGGAVALYTWMNDEAYFWQLVDKYLPGKDSAKIEQSLTEQKGEEESSQAQESDIHYPIPEDKVRVEEGETPETVQAQQEPEPLPELGESDMPLLDALSPSIDLPLFSRLFFNEAVINRFVVTVDNLMARNLPTKFRLSKPLKTPFSARKDDSTEQEYIDPANYQRYAYYIDFFESLNARQMVAVYVHYYPLFQEAYEGMGYPVGYFNDRLIEVIDHLLVTPEVKDPVALTRPSVYYKYAEPDLEKLTAGQKILVRVGHNNAARLKLKLRELRQELTKISRKQSD